MRMGARWRADHWFLFPLRVRPGNPLRLPLRFQLRRGAGLGSEAKLRSTFSTVRARVEVSGREKV
jgi:hypothetical protein